MREREREEGRKRKGAGKNWETFALLGMPLIDCLVMFCRLSVYSLDRLRVPPPVPTLDTALLTEAPSGGVPSLLMTN